MKNSRTLKLFFIVTVAVSMLSGCKHGISKKQSNITAEEASYVYVNTDDVKHGELNDRQKSILKLQGLPTDYDELSYYQKGDIYLVELLFTYLDVQYPDDEFTYVDYDSMGTGYREALYVLSKKIGSDRVVTVEYRREDGKDYFRDDYDVLADSSVYEDAIADYVRNKYPEARFFVDAKLFSTYYAKGSEPIMERASGAANIVIENVFEDEEDLKRFAQEMAKWKRNYNDDTPWWFSITVYENEDFDDATSENYQQHFEGRGNIYHFWCSMNSKGKLTIRNQN